MPDREYVPCGECVSFDRNRIDKSSNDGVCMERPLVGTMRHGEQAYSPRDADINGCSGLSEHKPVTEEDQP